MSTQTIKQRLAELNTLPLTREREAERAAIVRELSRQSR